MGEVEKERVWSEQRQRSRSSWNHEV